MKAIGYIRVSTQVQVDEGVSLAAQEERLRAYCTMNGLQMMAIVREEGVSGSVTLAGRPGGQELLRLMKEYKAKHIVALKLDRLFRDAEDALRQTRAWDKAGIALHLVDMGGQTLNTASAMGRLFLTMTAAFAELERNLIAERTTAALAHKKAHRQVYSPTPLGYQRQGEQLISDDEEMNLISRLHTMREQGRSLRSIANQLNTEGISGKQGGRWYASTVKYLLDNDLYVTRRSEEGCTSFIKEAMVLYS